MCLATNSLISTGEVPVEIAEIFFEFGQGFALRQVVRKFFEVAEPHIAVLPVRVASSGHSLILLRSCGPWLPFRAK
jgi:hypothetical protein